MAEYTPTTEEAVSAYLLQVAAELSATSTVSYTEAVEALYRLAELEAAAEKRGAAKALREAAEGYKHVGNMHARGWLLDRADQIEGDGDE